MRPSTSTRLRISVIFARAAAGLAGAVCALAIGSATAAAASPSVIGPYFVSPFKVRKIAYAFDQDPSWTRGGDVLSSQLDRAGIRQICRARLDGSDHARIVVRPCRRRRATHRVRRAGYRFDADAPVPLRLRRPGVPRRPLRGRRQNWSVPAAHPHRPGHSRVLLEPRLHPDPVEPRRQHDNADLHRSLHAPDRQPAQSAQAHAGAALWHAGEHVTRWRASAAGQRSRPHQQRLDRRSASEKPCAGLSTCDQEQRQEHDPRCSRRISRP